MQYRKLKGKSNINKKNAEIKSFFLFFFNEDFSLNLALSLLLIKAIIMMTAFTIKI